MIKCNVTMNGIVSRTASMRTNKEGKSYIGFAVKTTILARTFLPVFLAAFSYTYLHLRSFIFNMPFLKKHITSIIP